jgi:MacB-like periplasmic core domain
MEGLRIFGARLRGLFRKRHLDRELEAELQAHLESLTEENIRRGMNSKEAAHSARREFGGVEQTKELYREQRGFAFIDALLQDLRFALRGLAKSPGFAIVAILTLALGIGANTAIFSYIDAWIIKPLPYPQADRLMVFNSHDTKKGWTRNSVTSTADFFDFQKESTSFEQIAGWTGWNFNLTGDGPPALVEGGRVSWNYFDTLGAKPMLGRPFAPDEDQPGATHVAILSQGLWQSRFASEPKII